jgi:hypothetical protein
MQQLLLTQQVQQPQALHLLVHLLRLQPHQPPVLLQVQQVLLETLQQQRLVQPLLLLAQQVL